MTLVVEEKLGQQLVEVMNEALNVLSPIAAENKTLRLDCDRSKLLNEQEAVAYLRRDKETLRYYRRHGLPYYKKGADVWYKKGDIDDWLEKGKVSRWHG